MTNSRYRRLKELRFESYLLDGPVEVEKGALLFDNELKTVLLQLRMVNSGKRAVSAVHIRVDGLDDAGDGITGVKKLEHVYLDLNARPRMSFGDRAPVRLDPRVRNVRISIDKVTFEDGTVWRNTGAEEFSAPTQEPLRNLGKELLGQFQLEVDSLHDVLIDKSRFIPRQLEDMWLCSCGRANPDTEKDCCRCGMEKSWIFRHTEVEHLSRRRMEHLERVRITTEKQRILAEAAKKEAMERERTAKEKKALDDAKKAGKRRRYGIIAAVSVTVIVFAWKLFFQPYGSYLQGIDLYNKGDYTSAIRTFESIRSFKNSETWAEKARIGTAYAEAQTLIKSKKYDMAIRLLENHGGHDESVELLQKTKYDYAVSLYEKKHFLEARELFESIAESHDVNKYLNSEYYNIEGIWQYGDPVDMVRFTLKPGGILEIHVSGSGKPAQTLRAWWSTKENYRYHANGFLGDCKIVSVEGKRVGGTLILRSQLDSYGMQGMARMYRVGDLSPK